MDCIVSIDVGTRNLAYASVDVIPYLAPDFLPFRVRRMELLDLGTNKKVNEYIFAVIDELKYRENDLATASHVLIEAQDCSTSAIKRLYSAIVAYYYTVKETYNFEIVIVSPSMKYKFVHSCLPEFLYDIRQDYARRKAVMVYHFRYFLETDPAFIIIWKDYFESLDKKDDVADCMMQLIWYILNVLMPRCRPRIILDYSVA